MGNTVGTVYWDSHVNDAKFIKTFQKWCVAESIEIDTAYATRRKDKTHFAVESGGLSRNSPKVRSFIIRCAQALKMHDVKGVVIDIEELPM